MLDNPQRQEAIDNGDDSDSGSGSGDRGRDVRDMGAPRAPQDARNPRACERCGDQIVAATTPGGRELTLDALVVTDNEADAGRGPYYMLPDGPNDERHVLPLAIIVSKRDTQPRPWYRPHAARCPAC